MRKMIITLFLSLISLWAYGQKDWHLKRDEDGIKVYTTNTANSNFKSIKVICTVDATLSKLAAYLVDIDKQPQWVYNTKSSKQVKKIAPNEFIFYSEVSVPWPCTNRDYVAHFIIRQVSPTLLTIDSHAEPDLLPVKDGIVRVRKSASHWEITPVTKDKQQIVYTVEFDPAGAVPAWLTNLFVTKGPFETFEKLRAGVAHYVYPPGYVDFIKAP